MIKFNNLFKRKRAYVDTFKTDCGQKVLSDLISFCGYHKQIFVPNDPYATAFNAGKQRVLQHIQQILNASDEDLRRITEYARNE